MIFLMRAPMRARSFPERPWIRRDTALDAYAHVRPCAHRTVRRAPILDRAALDILTVHQPRAGRSPPTQPYRRVYIVP